MNTKDTLALEALEHAKIKLSVVDWAPLNKAITAIKQAQEPVDACEVLSTVMHFIPETEPELMKDVSELCHRLRAVPKQAQKKNSS
jgi:hypothetical protein